MLLPPVQVSVAVQAAVLVLPVDAVILQNIEHRGESTEDQSLTVVVLCLLEQLVQESHLAAHIDDMLSEHWSIGRLNAWEEVRVVADLPQLD